VSSTVESVLGHLPDETFWVDVVGKLVAEFWRLVEWCSQLEHHGARICDQLHGPPLGRARLANHLDEVVGQLGVELALRREADVELEALWTLAA
jgi:hypothetical protein